MSELARRVDTTLTSYTPPTISGQAEFIAAAFLAAYNGRTRESYTTDLRQYLQWCAGLQPSVDPLAAARAHVQVYARSLEEAGRKGPTIARKLSAIAGFYNYAVAEGLLDRSPVTHVRRPRISDESPRFGLDRDELGRLLAIANTHGPVAYALVCLLALNGLRVSEVCNTTVADLDTDRGHQLLTVTRKGGKRARIPLAARTAAAVAALPSITGGDASAPRSGVVAGHQPLLELDRFAAWRLIRRLADNAGITKRISPHSLRHTFVTLSLDAGVELRDVQDAAGHADPRTTRRYDRGRDSLDRAATYKLTSYLDENSET